MARKTIDSTFEYDEKEKSSKKSKKKNKKQRSKGKTALIVIAVLLVLAIAAYLTVAFGNFYPVKQLRETYIQTAMTTDEHQWLATMLFPKSVIEKAMKGNTFVDFGVNNPNIDVPVDTDDILKQKNLKVGDKDYAGNEILVNNIEQGILISKVEGKTFVGQIMLIDDPSRVYMGITANKNVKGQFMRDLLKNYDAIAGINASGFSDPGGVGTGGSPSSKCLYSGEEWGSYSYNSLTIGLDNENKFIVGKISSDKWDDYNLRDACQFGPALIVDGEQIVFGASGTGLHPRTIIGQRADGVIIFLIIDGRQVGYSIGATIGDCADIMMQYNAVNAAACDGGSSSVMGYDGGIINKPSATGLKETGRYLPNAWLVKKK